MAFKLNGAAAAQLADGMKVAISGAYLEFYAGAQPGTAGGTAGTLLGYISAVSLAWSANGTCSLDTPVESTFDLGGTITWARLTKYSSDAGGTAIIDGICGTASTCDFVISDAIVNPGDTVDLYDIKIVQPMV